MRDRAVDQRANPSQPVSDPRASTRRPREAATAPRRRLDQVEFARSIADRRAGITELWLSEVRARAAGWRDGEESLLVHFFTLVTSMLPAALGPYREQIEPLWQQTCELFGSIAAQRGLAAGEVIEEFQILREVLIRMFYSEAPEDGSGRVSLRDLLRLNRVIDAGVTHASIGHTDALFFSMFRQSGVPEPLSEDLIGEVLEQLAGLEEEFNGLMSSFRH